MIRGNSGSQHELPVTGEYLHIPIHSRDRLRAKLETGVAAYRARERLKPEGGHWRELYERLLAGRLDDVALREAIINYGESHSSVAEGPLLPHRIAPPMAHLVLDVSMPDAVSVRRRLGCWRRDCRFDKEQSRSDSAYSNPTVRHVEFYKRHFNFRTVFELIAISFGDPR
jgi:hypothetical protein